MHDAAANRDISIAKTGPLLVLEPRQQLEANLAICLIVLIDASDHRSERLDQIGAAKDADELAVLDDRDALDALTLQESCDLGERRLFGNRDHARRHDFADLLAVRLGEFFDKRGRTGHRLQPPRPMLFGADFGAMDQIGLAEHADKIARLCREPEGR